MQNDDGDDASAVFSASRARLKSLEARLAELRALENEEDQSGIEILLEVFSMLAAQARRFVAEEEYAAEIEPVLWDDHAMSARAAVVAVERSTALHLEGLARRPGRDLEPLVRPFCRLAKALTDRPDTELIFSVSDSYEYETWPDVFAEANENLESFVTAVDLNEPVAPAVSPGEDEQPADDLGETTEPGDDPGASGSEEAEPLRRMQRLPTVALVSYPIRADSDTLQHSAIAHEIAHLALLRSSPKTDVPLRDTAFEQAIQDPGGLKEQARGRLKRWLDELAADMIAVWTVGPAFIFALVDFVLPTQDTSYLRESPRYDTHPAMIWRLHRLRAMLADFRPVPGDSEAKKALVQVIDGCQVRMDLHQRLRKEWTEGEQIPDDLLPEGEHQVLKAALSMLEDQREELVPEAARYQPATLLADLDLVWDKLEQNIAPAERVLGRSGINGESNGSQAEGIEDGANYEWSESIDWRSILNGVYIYHLSGASRDGPLGADKPEDQRAADSRMARGSIELSELLRRMKERGASHSMLNDPEPGQ